MINDCDYEAEASNGLFIVEPISGQSIANNSLFNVEEPIVKS